MMGMGVEMKLPAVKSSLAKSVANCQWLPADFNDTFVTVVSMERCNVLVRFLCCESLGKRKQLFTAVIKVVLAKLALAQTRSLVFQLGVACCLANVPTRPSRSAKR